MNDICDYSQFFNIVKGGLIGNEMTVQLMTNDKPYAARKASKLIQTVAN